MGEEQKDQEQGEAEEKIEDLEVSDEQAGDVTGGAGLARRKPEATRGK